MVAQHFGAGKYERMRRNVAMSIYLCLAFVLVMTIALEILNYPILRLMNAPDGIIDDTAGYMAVIYAGLFATAAYNGLAAVMRALGDSRSPLYFLIIPRSSMCSWMWPSSSGLEWEWRAAPTPP